MISTGVGMLAWLFLASPYSVDDTLPLVERELSVLYAVLDVPVIAWSSGWPSAAGTGPQPIS